MPRAILYLVFRLATLALVFSCTKAAAQTQLPAEIQQKIDKVATDALAKTGVPSASVAVVKEEQIVYLHAYGNARLDPETAAKPEMRYSIGSISKQFTAAAILLLQEQGKLSLDDKVGKFIPSLTRANEVTIRQLLSHTSGYQDYWPQST
jgi:CubicO group peptidase (beta-lactamase class C family)